jgi:predicted amidohydrolase
MRIALYQHVARSGGPATRPASLPRLAGELKGRADLLVCPEHFMAGYKAGVAVIHRLAEAADGPIARALMRDRQGE